MVAARPGERAAELVVQGGEDGRLRGAVRADVRVQGDPLGERDDPQGLLAGVDTLVDLAPVHRRVNVR